MALSVREVPAVRRVVPHARRHECVRERASRHPLAAEKAVPYRVLHLRRGEHGEGPALRVAAPVAIFRLRACKHALPVDEEPVVDAQVTPEPAAVDASVEVSELRVEEGGCFGRGGERVRHDVELGRRGLVDTREYRIEISIALDLE